MRKTLLIILIFVLCGLAFGQLDRRAICSDCSGTKGKAIELPKPEYPKAAAAANAAGQVLVQVWINEKGKVVEAKVVSGHPLLHVESLKAAMKARFEPVIVGGQEIRMSRIITYNFVDRPKSNNNKKRSIGGASINKEEGTLPNCGGGVMIGKGISLPKPVFPQGGYYRPLVNTIIVSVTIDENGNVIEANAIAGHPLFRQSSVQAARFSKFTPSYVGCEKTKSFTEIHYTYDGRNGTVKVIKPNLRQTKLFEKIYPPENAGIMNRFAVNLPKPIYPQEANNFCVSGKVEVEVLVDEKGNVIEAKAISGDNLFREAAVEAALKANFSHNIGNRKVNGVLIYEFNPESRCIMTQRIVNKKAIYLPKPIVADAVPPKKSAKSNANLVKVEIIVDEEGRVTNARAISGTANLRSICEIAALKTKFRPTNDVGRIRVKAYLVYKIYLSGKVLTNF